MLDRSNSGSLFTSQFSVSWTNVLLHTWSIGLRTIFGFQFYKRDLREMHYHGALGFAKAYVFIHILLHRTWFKTSCTSKQIHTVIIKGDNQIIAESANAFALVIWTGCKLAVIIKITDYLYMNGTCESCMEEKVARTSVECVSLKDKKEKVWGMCINQVYSSITWFCTFIHSFQKLFSHFLELLEKCMFSMWEQLNL